MSVQARLAVAFSLVSGTVRPVTRASVNALLTSGRPNGVPLENSSLKWAWFVFMVRHVNHTLSVSVTVRPSRLRKTSPTERSSKNLPRHSFVAAAGVAVLAFSIGGLNFKELGRTLAQVDIRVEVGMRPSVSRH